MELWQEILLKTGFSLGVISVVMGIAAYSVLAERKVSSWIQGRVGPNRTTLPIIGAIPFIGPFLTRLGLFQPMADGLKSYSRRNRTWPRQQAILQSRTCCRNGSCLTTMVILPFQQGFRYRVVTPLILANVDVGVLFLFAVSP